MKRGAPATPAADRRARAARGRSAPRRDGPGVRSGAADARREGEARRDDRRRRLGAWACAALAFAGSAIAVAACRGGASGSTARPPLAAPPPPAAPARVAVSTHDPPPLRLAADDAALAGARDRERARDFTGAARIVDDARRAHPDAPDAPCAWAYVAGRLHLAANEPAEAALAFASAERPSCPLAAYARLRGAQALARAGRWEESLSRARAVPADLALRDENAITLAEASFARGDRLGAIAGWRALLAEAPRGPRWVDTAIHLAAALLDGGAGDPSAAAREAFDLGTRVVVEAPKVAATSGAERLRARAAALLRAKDASFSFALSAADAIRRAQAWLDASEASRALAEASRVYAPLAAATGPDACAAATVRARAVVKTKGPAADAWGDAIRACRGDDQLVVALFQGAKASASARRPDEAIARYAQVEHDFARHRLADDARLQGAILARDGGDEARFASMLLALPDDYPDGDMRGEALFRVALQRMSRGDWAGAKDPLDRAVALEPDDRRWATAGRAAYFRARVAELAGDADGARGARERYAEIVESYPLTFYMTQAYARLAQVDAPAAAATLERAVAREPEGKFVRGEHPELVAPAFERARELLEVGDVDAARREIQRGGYVEGGADPELVWIVADMYNRAGAPDLGHAFTRGRLTEHLAHYPAGLWRFAWEVAYPRAFEGVVTKESDKNGLPAALTWAVMREESSFIADVKSPANAFGLMQLIVPTAKLVAQGTGLPFDEASLKRADVNVALGTRMLSQLRGSFAVNRALAIAAYNAGPGAVSRWQGQRGADDFDLFVEEIPYEETRGYVKRVLSSQAAYAFLYARPALAEVLAIPQRVASR